MTFCRFQELKSQLPCEHIPMKYQLIHHRPKRKLYSTKTNSTIQQIPRILQTGRYHRRLFSKQKATIRWIALTVIHRVGNHLFHQYHHPQQLESFTRKILQKPPTRFILVHQVIHQVLDHGHVNLVHNQDRTLQ